DPETAVPIFRQRENLIARQPVARGVSREAFIPEKIQPAAPGADPKVPGAVCQQAAHVIAGEAVLRRVKPEAPVVVTCQPSTNGAQPEASRAVFGQGQNLVALKFRGIVVAENHKAHAVKTRGSLNRAQPQVAVARPQDG